MFTWVYEKLTNNEGIREYGFVMKTTIELPDALYRQVKAKSSINGQTVRQVTERLYELWLAGRLTLAAGETAEGEGRGDWVKRWVRETDELAEQIRRSAVDKRTCRDILQADRR